MKTSIIRFSVITSFFILTMMTSCDEDNHDHANVQINLTSPSTASMFHMGDTVKIKGTITADTEMHGYEVKIKNLTANTVAFVTDYHDHAASFTINEQWINNVTTHSDMRLVVKVEVDHTGTEVSDSLDFHCHPM